MFNFLGMYKYDDQTHCENLDCVGQSEIGQAGYLLNHPRMSSAKCHCSIVINDL